MITHFFQINKFFIKIDLHEFYSEVSHFCLILEPKYPK